MFKSKNKKIISITILILVVFFGVFFLTSHKTIKETLPTISNLVSDKTGKKQVNPFTQTTFEINGVNYQETITEKISVYDFMSKLRNEGKINFVEKNYIGMGEFITEINGLKNNNERSWIYYVNGKEASVGVSNYKINPGDTLSWKYEKSNY